MGRIHWQPAAWGYGAKLPLDHGLTSVYCKSAGWCCPLAYLVGPYPGPFFCEEVRVGAWIAPRSLLTQGTYTLLAE